MLSGQYWKEWIEEPNSLYGFLTKYNGSLNNASRANGDFWEQIFARDFNNSGETEEVQWKLDLAEKSVSQHLSAKSIFSAIFERT